MNRPPRAKPRTIQFNRAKTASDPTPDWWVNWGEGADKGTANLVLSELSKLGNELIRRGYDPLSIRFSVSKAQEQQP